MIRDMTIKGFVFLDTQMTLLKNNKVLNALFLISCVLVASYLFLYAPHIMAGTTEDEGLSVGVKSIGSAIQVISGVAIPGGILWAGIKGVFQSNVTHTLMGIGTAFISGIGYKYGGTIFTSLI